MDRKRLSGWRVLKVCLLATVCWGLQEPGLIRQVIAAEGGGDQTSDLQRFEFEQIRFAAPARLAFYARSEVVANPVSRQIFDRLKQLDQVMSDYDPDSELSRLCRTAGSGQAVPVSEDLWAVLVESQRLAEQTDGAFDVTIGPVIKLWRTARRRKTLPTDDEIREALSRVGYRHVKLNAHQRTVELTLPGMQIDLGGVGQGYAADAAFEILKAAGITRALVDISGDIRLGDAPPGRDGWRIEIEALQSRSRTIENPLPERMVSLTNCAISTSGDAYQFFELEGVRYSHIVDARTGRPMTQSCSVTVIAPTARIADAIDTPLCLLDAPGRRKLIEAFPGALMLSVRLVDDVPVVEELGDWTKVTESADKQQAPTEDSSPAR